MTDRIVLSHGASGEDSEKLGLHRYAPALRQNWHQHDYGIVCLVLEGQARERLSRSREWSVQPFQVGIKPPDLRHAEQFGETGVVAIRMVYDSTRLEALGRFAQPLLGWRWIPESATTDAVLTAMLCSDGDDVVYEVAASVSTPAREPSRAAPGWLQQTAEFARAHFRGPIGLSALTAVSGAHPVYVARMFRRYYGTSAGEYVQRLRLRDAVRQLAIGTPIATAAARAGFADQAHLTRIMRRMLGITPGRARHRLLTLPVQIIQDTPRHSD